jgi:hypothetical protein
MEQLLFIIPKKFWKQCLAFYNVNFLLPIKKKNVINKGKRKKERKLSCVLAITLTRGCLIVRMTSSAFAMLMFESMEYLTRAKTTFAHAW